MTVFSIGSRLGFTVDNADCVTNVVKSENIILTFPYNEDPPRTLL